MSMTPGGNKELRADINVTPLIDVLLVLLIIFMVIVPSSSRGLDALIPQPPRTADPAGRDRQPIIVQVLGDSQHGVTYKINETALGHTDVEAKLAQIFAIRTDKTMFIQGDAGLDFSLVADVINSGHQAGVDNIGIMTPQAARQH